MCLFHINKIEKKNQTNLSPARALKGAPVQTQLCSSKRSSYINIQLVQFSNCKCKFVSQKCFYGILLQINDYRIFSITFAVRPCFLPNSMNLGQRIPEHGTRLGCNEILA